MNDCPHTGDTPAQAGASAAATTPGADALAHIRPTTAMEMVDRVFEIMRRHLPFMMGLGALYALPTLLVGTWVILRDGNADDALTRVALVGAVVAKQLPLAALAIAAFQAALFPGRILLPAPAFRSAFALLPQFMVIVLLIVLMLMGFAVVLPAMLSRTAGAGSPLGLILAPMSMAMGLFVTLAYSLAPIVVLVEKRWFFAALGRSAELTRLVFRRGLVDGDSPFRRVALVALFPLAATLAAEGLARMLVVAASTRAPSVAAGTITGDMFSLLIACAVSVVTAPALMCGLALVYIECRVRLEALDLQVRLVEIGRQ